MQKTKNNILFSQFISIIYYAAKTAVQKKQNYTQPAHEIKTYLDNTYKSSITFWDVSISDPLEVDFEDNQTEGLDTELPDVAAYTKEMRNIRKALKKRSDYNKNNYYVFLVKKSEKGKKNGIMPFNRHFGFMFMENSQQLKANSQKLYHTIAHELAHGAFTLYHTFSTKDKGITQGSTFNLMDYSTKQPDNLLRKYQWYIIHNPRLSLFGGDEEEVSSTMEFLFEDPDLVNFLPSTESGFVYLTPAAKPIIISGHHTPSFNSKWPELVSEQALVSFIIDEIKYVALYSKKDDKIHKFKGYVDIDKFKNDKTQDYYQGNDKKPKSDFPIKDIRVQKDGELSSFTMNKKYSKDEDEDIYKGAGEIYNINSIKNISDLVYVALPNELKHESKEILAEVFLFSSAMAIEAGILLLISTKFPNMTFGVGYGADVSLTAGIGVGEGVGIGLVIHNGEIRSYGDLSKGIEFSIEPPIPVSLSFTLRRTIIWGDFDDYSGYSIGIGGCLSIYFIRGCANFLYRWPHENPTFSQYVLNLPAYPEKSIIDLSLYGFSVELGVGTDIAGISMNLTESYATVPSITETEKLANESNDMLESIFDVELDLTIPKYEKIAYDNLNDYYLIQISANRSLAEKDKLNAFYKNEITTFYQFYDNCDEYYKYFIPKKFASLNKAKEFIDLLYSGEQENENKPFIVKYNKNIDGIIQKYSAYSNYTNSFFNEKNDKVLEIDKTIYDFGDISVGVEKNVEFTLTNVGCKPIDINSIKCDNTNIKFNYNKSITNIENLKINYKPKKKGPSIIPIKIITDVGIIEIKIMSNVN